ncbi:L-ribulose-5-phosphate 4-epimerase [Telmatospirillum sp.]|uniref:L-ribulose-5-phosphate 4-epimerase n=1 Tax=Telmatospirillum sp. TaxID=2079197 RepID=UPI00284B94C5|nr:L-ribulose-5-phosphate 4-epimerase [Telmatospirillum sp.]MDR3440025.1 L-ribulose-5-phosphate 4-epimerase [Telmatospirillum sp.]
MTILDLKRDVLAANLELSRRGLALFTWGNASAIDRTRGLVVIKPSGVPYDQMEADDMVVVALDGTVEAGRYKPSSDLATHLELYRAFGEIGGVVHTHSPHATAWAQAGVDLPAEGTTHADYFYGAVPCTRPLTEIEIGGAYERETGKVIVETMNDRNLAPLSMPAALVDGHGPFTWGASAADAVHNAVVLEEVAHIAILSRNVGTSKPMSRALLDRHFLRKHGPAAYYGQN